MEELYGKRNAQGAVRRVSRRGKLLAVLRETAARLGRNPSKKEVFCVYRVFLIQRFGNWPRALTAAGLKRPASSGERTTEEGMRKRSGAGRHRNCLGRRQQRGRPDNKNGRRSMMKERLKRGAAALLALIMVLGLSGNAFAAVSDDTLTAAIEDTAQYIYETVKSPQVGSIGGEWAVLGLVRSGYTVPEEYYQDYYATVESYVRACKGELHDKKYTEYSRVIVALSAIGKKTPAAWPAMT